MFRLLGNLLSPSGDRARLSILMFHRVLEQPDPLLPDEIDAAAFDQHMRFVRREFNVLPLDEACARLARNSLPSRAMSLTFDDGYANNADVALPILERHGLTATFFVATSFLDGSTMFNDDIIEIVRTAPARQHDLSAFGLGSTVIGNSVDDVEDTASRRALIAALIPRIKYASLDERRCWITRLASTIGGRVPRDLMMRPDAVRRLADHGMQIGGHTVNHPILMQLNDSSAEREIVDGKHMLEDIIGKPVTLFAYPNGKPGGDYDARHAAIVRRAGFEAAVSTVNGVADRNTDRFQLPRCGLWNQSPRRVAARLLVNCLRPVTQTSASPPAAISAATNPSATRS
jgi:peptidoglycan/xylan/chitin deacetylase (PgdA/CDA1 family)